MAIAENLERIRQEINALDAQNRVQLLAVSKTFPESSLEEAIAGGQRLFGENYAQEGVRKIQYFREHYPNLALQWHFIGPVQSNKTKLIAEHFDWVQSVDRLKIAQRLSEQRPQARCPLNVLLEVNVDGEDTKSGVDVPSVGGMLEQIARMPNLRLRGLMCIPRPAENAEQRRKPFKIMKALFDQYQAPYGLDTLSMGMSADYREAIEEGANMVRIGSAIFGARHYASK